MKTGFDNIVIHRILRCSVNKYTKLTNNYTWYDFPSDFLIQFAFVPCDHRRHHYLRNSIPYCIESATFQYIRQELIRTLNKILN